MPLVIRSVKGSKLTSAEMDGNFTYLEDLTDPKAPAAFTSRALTNADDGSSLVCASAQVATVNTGLVAGFGCAFKGVVTFSGSATVTDVRATGSANPWCSLVQTAANVYDVVGTKA